MKRELLTKVAELSRETYVEAYEPGPLDAAFVLALRKQAAVNTVQTQGTIKDAHTKEDQPTIRGPQPLPRPSGNRQIQPPPQMGIGGGLMQMLKERFTSRKAAPTPGVTPGSKGAGGNIRQMYNELDNQ